VTGSGSTPSPWGEPARVPTVTARPARTVVPPAQTAPVDVGALAAHRVVRPTRRERARAVLTMLFVAIVLGAAAAGVLGVGVWALAALFHHAASN